MLYGTVGGRYPLNMALAFKRVQVPLTLPVPPVAATVVCLFTVATVVCLFTVATVVCLFTVATVVCLLFSGLSIIANS